MTKHQAYETLAEAKASPDIIHEKSSPSLIALLAVDKQKCLRSNRRDSAMCFVKNFIY